MGRVQVGSTVRHVSPVTARLFAKVRSETLGIWPREVLLRVGATAAHEHNSRIKKRNCLDEESQASLCNRLQALQSDATSGESEEKRPVEVVQPPSPPRTDRLICPQIYLESILQKRGYEFETRSSAKEGCHCNPSQKQMDDYQVPLLEAVRKSDLSALSKFAAQGVDMGAANRFGESVIHLATRRGSAPVLEFLLSHGASLHICDDYGKTPLHDAFWASEPRFDLVSIILEKHWRLLHAADIRGATPFRYVKKRHWGQWCDFLDRVKDVYWPNQEDSGTLESGEDRLQYGEHRDGDEGRCAWTRRDDEGGGD